jgi:acetolactate synthase-1/2/3 large subunit
MHGNYGPNILTNECDVLIALGMRFDDRVTGNVSKYAKQAKVIHLDIDASELNKIIKADCPIHCDVLEGLKALTPLIEKRDHSDWLNRFKDCAQIEYDKVLAPILKGCDNKIKMVEVVELLNRMTEGKAIVSTDVGQHQMVTSRYYLFEEPYLNVTSGGLGTMGYGLPAAIGAKIAMPKKQVIAIVGDGGFQMTLQELGTMMQDGIAVKILILNNNFLGMVRQWQQLFFDKRYSFTELKNPDFVKLASAYNINGQKVTDMDKLEAALKAMLDSEEAYLLEVVVEKEENVFPMVPTGASVAEILLEEVPK